MALRELAGLPDSRLIRCSSLYRNPPEGGRVQPDFVNAVAEIETRLGPGELLARLLEVERAHGRVRSLPNAPRTLDLDIVLYGSHAVHETDLAIPHPRMRERAFVMVPLCEIAPDAVVPGHGRVADLLGKVDTSGMIRLAETGAE
jgi:2-amino-4-hydroxy-6-hydroxymethyldihydropteridine diphosphokinase